MIRPITDRKDISPFARWTLLLAGSVLLVLLIFAPFLHNHEPDLKIHDECPAHFLAISVLALISVYATDCKSTFGNPIPAVIETGQWHQLQNPYFLYINKAPPSVQ